MVSPKKLYYPVPYQKKNTIARGAASAKRIKPRCSRIFDFLMVHGVYIITKEIVDMTRTGNIKMRSVGSVDLCMADECETC